MTRIFSPHISVTPHFRVSLSFYTAPPFKRIIIKNDTNVNVLTLRFLKKPEIFDYSDLHKDYNDNNR